jgi:DNA-3-methyladenine glycosylase I
MNATIQGPDGKPRCRWCAAAPEFLHYHDEEWGYPVADDIRLFEKICLEGFQSGLSWRTILAKRENFRKAFLGFDFNKLARFGERDVERLLQDEGIVRHRGKIEAVIHNAGRAREMVAEAGSLAAFFWRFEPPGPGADASQPLSRELKKRGWKFVGPTTVYAFMQAMGLVNDHAPECVAWKKAAKQRKSFLPPV